VTVVLLGHGPGLGAQQLPYVAEGNAEPVAQNTVFSDEPAVHCPGRIGARIEDIPIVTAGGGHRFYACGHDGVEVS